MPNNLLLSPAYLFDNYANTRANASKNIRVLGGIRDLLRRIRDPTTRD